MADTGDKSELDRAVDQHRAEAGPEQALLPLLTHDVAAENSEVTTRGKGRPAGSRNLRSEAYAALLIREAGADPLAIATRIAATDMLDPAAVQLLAETWGCSRFEAVKLWAQISRDAQPYLHQQLPRAVILNPGAPGGERVLMEIDGQYTEVGADGYPGEAEQ